MKNDICTEMLNDWDNNWLLNDILRDTLRYNYEEILTEKITNAVV